jgi:hypothetical protein
MEMVMASKVSLTVYGQFKDKRFDSVEAAMASCREQFPNAHDALYHDGKFSVFNGIKLIGHVWYLPEWQITEGQLFVGEPVTIANGSMEMKGKISDYYGSDPTFYWVRHTCADGSVKLIRAYY